MASHGLVLASILTHTATVTGYRLHGDEYVADPYPLYRRMAEESPVWLQETTGHVYLSRFADVRAVLMDSEGFRNDRVADRLSRTADGMPAQCLAAILHDRLVMTDGAHHRALRQQMRESFTAQHVRGYEPVIREVVEGQLDKLDWRSPVDFLGAVALPIPSQIILRVLGFPPTDFVRLRRWTSDFYNWLAASPGTIEERTERAYESTEAMRSYVTELLRQPPDSTVPGLLGRLLAAHHAGVLTQDEVVANLIGLINAAHETTTSLMANAMILLIRHPDQLALLLEQPSLLSRAVAEVGRLESPAQIISRVVAQDREFGGLSLRKGQLVALNLAQANRDPDVYPDPDRFDITRRGPSPLTFGHGEHFCVGTALATLEAEILLATLLPRMSGATILNEPIAWRPTPAFRCPSALAIQFAQFSR